MTPTDPRGRGDDLWGDSPPATWGEAAGRLVDAIASRHGNDFMSRLDELGPDERSVAVLEYAVRMTYADGLQAVYATAIDRLGEELIRATEHIGAPAYADLFRRALEALPPAVRHDGSARDDFLIDHVEVLDGFDDEFYALEDAGDVLIVHAVRYAEAHPEEFSG